MDQQTLWTGGILDQVETQNMPDSPASSSEDNMPYIDMPGEDSADMSIWNSSGPSSNQLSLDQDSSADEGRLETTLMLLGSRIGEGRMQMSRMRPVGSLNLNLNGNQEDISQSFPPNPSFPINTDHNSVNVGGSSPTLEVGQRAVPFMTGSSSGGIEFLSERVEGTAENSFEGRRLSCKRKSTASGSSACIYQDDNGLRSISGYPRLSSSSNYPSGVNPSTERLNPRIGTSLNVGASDQHHNIFTEIISSQRNCRIRTHPHQYVASSPNPWPRENNLSPAHRSSDPFVPFNPPFEPRVAVAGGTLESQSPVLPAPTLVPVTHLLPMNVASSSRSGSSSRYLGIAGEWSAPSREETNIRSMPRNHILEQSVPVPQNDIRHLVQHSSSWSLARAPQVAPTSQAGSSSRVALSSGPASVPHQNHPSHYHQRLPVVTRRSIPSGPDQSIYGPAQPSSLPDTLQELNQSAFRSLQQMRSLLPSGSVHSINTPTQPSSFTDTLQELNQRSLRNLQQVRSLLPAGSGQSIDIPTQPSSISSTLQLHQRALRNLQQVRSLLPSGSGQSIDIPTQPSSISSTLQLHQRALRSLHQQIRSASAILGDLSSMPSLSHTESRSRVLSEIRNANARMEHIEAFEERMFLFDQAVLYGGALDLQDMHRDMRLDVDNMSYEELLALTERIGDVSTGLSEETILKCLKQRKYIFLSEEPSNEEEPCCICQEEYEEEQDVGRLDCGHDFHTACIKEWLMLKNSCPICKTTGLGHIEGEMKDTLPPSYL